ncbi:MAG: hypothetical protein HC906_14875 [Bacteroidales bacterium]|nr:hypothetical protein [Bacteroidales bacterium]
MGLMKYYRQSYCDLIHLSAFDSETIQYFLLFTNRCFDRIEISYTKEWATQNESTRIEEMQESTRNLTNEKKQIPYHFRRFLFPIDRA